jgi:hypothetical protein
MNSQVASYYRAVLFADGQDATPLPKSLIALHMFAEKRHHALGLGSTITKATALAISLTWLSGTVEGREFAAKRTNLGDMFSAEDLSEVLEDRTGSAGDNRVDWFKVKAETPVVVEDKGVTYNGSFLARRANWLDVRVNGEEKHFRPQQVQLAGA